MLIRLTAVLVLSAVLGCSSESKTACEKAGGTCSAITPGACLGQYVAEGEGFSCESSNVCCLPLTQSPCELAGGACVEDGGCKNGTLESTADHACSNAGGPAQCCIPAADGGT